MQASYTQNALKEIFSGKSCAERVAHFLKEIEKRDSQVGAFIDVYGEWATE